LAAPDWVLASVEESFVAGTGKKAPVLGTSPLAGVVSGEICMFSALCTEPLLGDLCCNVEAMLCPKILVVDGVVLSCCAAACPKILVIFGV
jgi:hypothetical protein